MPSEEDGRGHLAPSSPGRGQRSDWRQIPQRRSISAGQIAGHRGRRENRYEMLFRSSRSSGWRSSPHWRSCPTSRQRSTAKGCRPAPALQWCPMPTPITLSVTKICSPTPVASTEQASSPRASAAVRPARHRFHHSSRQHKFTTAERDELYRSFQEWQEQLAHR